MNAAVVATGSANLASVLTALARAGLTPRVTTDPSDVRDAPLLILPGVGVFGAAMHHLRVHHLVGPIRERILANRPTLAICLGLQLLAESGEESPGVAGLGVLPVRVARFPLGARAPLLAWRTIRPDAACAVLRSGVAYFAHSYRLDGAPEGWGIARAEHAGAYTAAIERGPVLACQFHPELSGPWGRSLLARWAARVRDEELPSSPAEAPPPAGDFRRVIPCLDVRDGRVVKGVRFQGLRDAGDPAELAARYEASGADELVILDVVATDEARRACLETVRRVRRVLSIPLTVGGGVRAEPDACALLDAGADRVGVNTAAVREPAFLTGLRDRFGAQCVVLAIDARRATAGHEVVVRAGREPTGLDAGEWAARGVARGAGEILLTSIDRDGTGAGYDLDLLRRVRAAVSVPIIASGGASTPGHMRAALDAGADAVLAASILHDAHWTVDALKRSLADDGVPVRPATPTQETPC